jgi:hypothetical protein
MDRTRSRWHWMLWALTAMLITLPASPARARSISYSEDGNFRVTIPFDLTPTADISCFNQALVHDLETRNDQSADHAQSDGATRFTMRHSATVPPLAGPHNSASAKSVITVNRYTNSDSGDTIITGGYKLSGKAVAKVPLDATSISTASAYFQGQVTSPSGQITYGPLYHAGSSAGGRVQRTSTISAEAIYSDLVQQGNLFEGIVELSGNTTIQWNSRRHTKNLIIYAPQGVGNNVHFLLDFPDGPFTQGLGKFELTIEDGNPPKIVASGKLFEGVEVVDKGRGRYYATLTPVTFPYNLLNPGKGNPLLKITLNTEDKSQEEY